MGQYHFVANLDKKEYLHPHTLGDGLKLMEFGASGNGTMEGLALLLAVSNGVDGRGGGDFHVWDGGPGYEGREVEGVTPQDYELAAAVIGRWGGDRIAIIGDYAEDGDLPGFVANSDDNPWQSEGEWTDISASVRRVMGLDYYTAQAMTKAWNGEDGDDPYAILATEAT